MNRARGVSDVQIEGEKTNQGRFQKEGKGDKIGVAGPKMAGRSLLVCSTCNAGKCQKPNAYPSNTEPGRLDPPKVQFS